MRAYQQILSVSLPSRTWLLVLPFVIVLRLQGQSLDPFDPGPDGRVYAIAEQPDGRFLLGGSFVTISAQQHYRLVRYNSNMTPDTSFSAWAADNAVHCFCVQTDGTILLGGSFTTVCGSTRNCVARVNSSGWVDSFNPSPNGTVHCILQQPDGKIVVGGEFSSIGGQWRALVARLTSEGALDPVFRPGTFGFASRVNTLALQGDGKILIGGEFSGLGGQPCIDLARLNPDGSFDGTFQTAADGPVDCLAIQPDGRILVGGHFTTLGGIGPGYLSRLLPGGTVDPTFNPALDGAVLGLALQTDGKLLVAGQFASNSGVPSYGLAQLDANGASVEDFCPYANYWPDSLGLRDDGRILVSGEFTMLSDGVRSGFGCLKDTAPGSQRLEYGGSVVTWRRGPTAPALTRATCEFSTDGTTWTRLDSGTNIAGAWQFDATAVPATAALRARGWFSGGRYNGSSWFAECTGSAIPNTPPVIVVSDGNLGFRSGRFGFNISGPVGETVVVQSSSDLVNWTAEGTNTLGSGPFYFSDPESSAPGSRFYRLLVP